MKRSISRLWPFPIRPEKRFGLLSRQELFRALWLGLLIGVVAGGGAIVFAWSIEFATRHLLEGLAGYRPAQPLGEGGRAFATGPDRPWALPLVLGLGGLVSGLLVFLLAPEAEGHGTDAAIDSFHRKGGRIRLRVVPVKLVASAITIGSGGAAGREGPTAQIGAGFGSFIADRFRLGAIERRKAVAAGVGAGIGSIFRAPLGGAMMAAEVLYKHDLEADVILLALISAIVGYSVYGSWAGWQPIFGGGAGFSFSHPGELGYYAALGVICGLVGMLYARGFYGITALFHRLHVPRPVKPAIGGVLVGCIGIVSPDAIHVGYGTVQQMLTPEGVRRFSLVLLIALPFLRILTTSLSIGSGGSGGIFGPGMVIGAAVGGASWRLFHGMPGFPAEPGPVVIICMIAAFGSIAHAPLAMLLMVGEMTGNLSLLAPAMVAVAIASLVVGDETIYESQVDTRADSPAHRHRFAFPLLSALPAGRAATPIARWVRGTPVSLVLASARPGLAIVVDANDHLVGELPRGSVERAAATDPSTDVASLAVPFPAIVGTKMALDEALDLLASTERRWLPVVDVETETPVGAIDAGTLVRSYREAARAGMRRAVPGEQTGTFELPLGESSPLSGKQVRDAALPTGVRIVTLDRDAMTIAPDGDTVLLPGDILTIWCSDGTRAGALDALLAPQAES